MKLEKYGTAGDVQELLEVRDHIDELAVRTSATASSQPRADMIDRGDAFQVHLEVPGVSQADLEIAVEDGELLIAGLREPPFAGGRTIFSERSVGPFQRTFPLPGPVDPEQATAHLAAGVLVVTLPKLAEG